VHLWLAQVAYFIESVLADVEEGGLPGVLPAGEEPSFELTGDNMGGTGDLPVVYDEELRWTLHEVRW